MCLVAFCNLLLGAWPIVPVSRSLKTLTAEDEDQAPKRRLQKSNEAHVGEKTESRRALSAWEDSI